MPMKLEKSDRRLLMWVALILLPMFVAVALSSPEEEESSIPSSYSTQKHGAKAAYLLLKESGYDVERWEKPPGELPLEAAHTTLVLAGPIAPPSPEDKAALQSYLNRGGRIVATSSSAEFYLPKADIEREALPARLPNTYKPLVLSAITRCGDIKMSPTGYWSRSSTSSLTHYADNDRPIVVSYKVGKGEVVWWAASTPLSNGAIGDSGNLALLLNSLGDIENTQVFWDEYFHGYRHTVGEYFSAAPVKFAALQGALIMLAVILTYSRRNGPIHPLAQTSRLSPLEFVETLGSLYRRANATHSALEIPYQRFRFLATRQLGLKSDVSAADLAQALTSRFGNKDSQLAPLLQEIENALYDSDLKEARALDLVQQLSYHEQRLKLLPS